MSSRLRNQDAWNQNSSIFKEKNDYNSIYYTEQTNINFYIKDSY